MKQGKSLLKNVNIDELDITSFSYEESPKIKEKIPISGWFWPIHDEFAKSGVYRDFKPLPYALETLEYLKRKGYELFVITSRDPDLHNIEEDTKISIEKNFSGFFSEIYFKPKEAKKAEICKGLAIRVLIEDELDHIIEATKYSQLLPILVDRPYNQTSLSLHNIQNGNKEIFQEGGFWRVKDLSNLINFDKI